MNELFGLPTTVIAAAVVVLLGAVVAITAGSALRDRTSFRIGIRNIRRRPERTVLVVVGLMLSTLIVTAAFATGDTIDHTLTKGAYDLFQRSDVDITWTGERNFGDDAGATVAASYVSESGVRELERVFRDDQAIEGFLPWLNGNVAAVDGRSGRASPSLMVAGFDPDRLSRLGGLRLTDGQPAGLSSLAPNEIYLNRRAARDLDAVAGDVVTLYGANGASRFIVAGIVEDELASGMLGLDYSSAAGGAAMPLTVARMLLGLEDGAISALTVVLRGDVRSTARDGTASADCLASYLDVHGADLFGPKGASIEVFPAKQDLVTQAEVNGNIFTTFFLILGLFSVAAGVLLIFTIFVILAAERRAELGIARAIGAQRGSLVRSFLAEGMAYSLAAGFLGAPLGVLASLGLTNVLLRAVGGDYFAMVESEVTWQSIVIGYGLGVVITFAIVSVAALRVTHVNIVSAVRNLPEERIHATRRQLRWRWVLASLPALVVPPLGLWWLLRKGLGLPWSWILAPAGIVLGALLVMLGRATDLLFPFALGVSLVPLCGAALVTIFGAPRRPVWTAVGVALLAYWLLPPAQHDALFGEFDSAIEMFVLAGIMIVVAATLITVFNATLLSRLFARSHDVRVSGSTLVLGVATAACAVVGVAFGDAWDGAGQLALLGAGVLAPITVVAWGAGHFSWFAPALKMAIAYPLANRVRTGMTIAMFSLVVFSLTVFSVLIANFAVLDGGDAARGNLDIVTTAAPGGPTGGIKAALRDTNSPAGDAITSEGRTTIGTGNHQVRLAGSDTWYPYPLVAADDGFLGSLSPALEFRANGYASDAEVLEAVRTNPELALIDRYGAGQGFGSFEFTHAIEATGGAFIPFEVEVRDAATGATHTYTIVGVLKTHVASSTVSGVYVSEAAYRALGGMPDYRRSYLRLTDGVDASGVARDIQAALATRGVRADAVSDLLERAATQNNAFTRMMQAFMALGLLVGIAGLGVVAFRSVAERRQQIGMLRSIGYQRSTIQLAFLLESTFVSLVGVLSGVLGGSIVARNLLTSDTFVEGTTISLNVPFAEIAAMCVAALAVSLVTSWWPSRGASRVPVAEALRYE